MAWVPQPMDLLGAPLKGMTLIEAAAGTGKTYSITALYLRLVLEEGYAVDQILVITYTKAATAELRERIRARLSEARLALQSDEGASWYAALAQRLPDRAQGIERLSQTLSSFDRAAIHTIHGFCQQVLSDHAFESAAPFESELLADEREVLQGIVEDFWRQTFYRAPALFIDYVRKHSLSPDRLLAWVQPHLGKPFLQVVEPHDAPALAPLEAAFVTAYRVARSQWQASREEVVRLLAEAPELRRNKYPKGSAARLGRLLDAHLDRHWPSLTLFTDTRLYREFKRLTVTEMAQSVKKGAAAPQHPFFQACEALAGLWEPLKTAYDQQSRIVRHRLLKYANRELERRKRVARVRSFNDLLIHLERALHGERGEQLVRVLRQRYPAVLVDEFQDTDPIQFRILERVYRGTGLPVFLVGDPKQAIYGFRGADVFAYLKAQCDAECGYSLAANWRSSPALVRAVNALFANAPRPFVFPEIGFSPCRPAERASPLLSVAGAAGAALHLWFIGRGKQGVPLAKGAAEQRAAQATAAEVARLLSLGARGVARIGARPLGGGDMAILVRNHRQGWAVRSALLALGVPSVQQAQESELHSEEAAEVERVQLAVAEPEREPLVRGALATDLLGETGEGLYRLMQDEEAWAEHLGRFHVWHELWRDRGFIRMFRHLLQSAGVARRLLGHADGARRLTNVLHLAELLEGASVRRQLGMEGLVHWLAEQREATTSDLEEEQLRLETDEHLVKIVTVHKSKGLEYPIVFCPFLWDGKLWSRTDTAVTFHDRREDYQPTLFLGASPSEEARRWAQEEELAESLRLLYVALTRARHRCYLVCGAIKGAESSALAWLLHPPSKQGETASLEVVAEHVRSRPNQALMADLVGIAETSHGAIQVQAIPEAAGEPFVAPTSEAPRLAPRAFTGSLRLGWQVSSFSALAHQQAAELPDHDGSTSIPASEPEAEMLLDIHAFPKGADAGQCLHAIFERVDFTLRDRAAFTGLVLRTLVAHGFSEDWTAVVEKAVEQVLATPLDEARTIRLQDVPASRRLNELEFHYAIADVSSTGLGQVLAEHGMAQAKAWTKHLAQLEFFSPSGFMKGFIDLVFEAEGRFYLVDYKSNWLGPDREAYAREQLPAVMAREVYYLQYLIYTVAVHRYLRRRVPGYCYHRQFGGVFYLFLRGMTPERGPAGGVFADRPAPRLIAALDRYLATGMVERTG